MWRLHDGKKGSRKVEFVERGGRYSVQSACPIGFSEQEARGRFCCKSVIGTSQKCRWPGTHSRQWKKRTFRTVTVNTLTEPVFCCTTYDACSSIISFNSPKFWRFAFNHLIFFTQMGTAPLAIADWPELEATLEECFGVAWLDQRELVSWRINALL
jgi:hypothetical protein